MSIPELQVCIIGVGPRGLSVLERLLANAGDRRLTVHLVDPHPAGAGQVWRTEQPDCLLMNTVASQVTVFTDETVEMSGRLRLGPSLYEWARHEAKYGTPDAFGVDVAQEIRSLGPDTYSSRRLVGYYLGWVLRWITANAPAGTQIVEHRASAVTLWDEPDGHQAVRLDNGERLTSLNAVVLAMGHYPVEHGSASRTLSQFADEHGLTYIAPANPADVDLSVIRPGEPTLLRGQGLCFFDYMALLTVGRGGRFTMAGDRLVYKPSGFEPRLFAGSRRGVPYQARGANQKGPYGRHEPRVLTVDVVDRLRREAGPAGMDFQRDLWPLISKEVQSVYYSTLLRARAADGVVERFEAEYLAWDGDHAQEDALLRRYGIADQERWNWDRITQPCAGLTFDDPAGFTSWLVEYLERDIDEARRGNVEGPTKAAMDVLRDLRNEVRLAVDHGGLAGRSYRDDLESWYSPMNAFLSIGPPCRRAEELLALVHAGVLEPIGPQLSVSADADAAGFVVSSPRVNGSRRVVSALIEARLHISDLARTADPLLAWMAAAGTCTPHRIADPAGDVYRTGGLAITQRPFHPIDVGRRAHPRRFVFGVPTEGAHWATAAGARPGVNSVLLGDSDAIACAVLELSGAEDNLRSTEELVAAR